MPAGKEYGSRFGGPSGGFSPAEPAVACRAFLDMAYSRAEPDVFELADRWLLFCQANPHLGYTADVAEAVFWQVHGTRRTVWDTGDG